jgi:hypothetical protein
MYTESVCTQQDMNNTLQNGTLIGTEIMKCVHLNSASAPVWLQQHPLGENPPELLYGIPSILMT